MKTLKLLMVIVGLLIVTGCANNNSLVESSEGQRAYEAERKCRKLPLDSAYYECRFYSYKGQSAELETLTKAWLLNMSFVNLAFEKGTLTRVQSTKLKKKLAGEYNNAWIDGYFELIAQ